MVKTQTRSGLKLNFLIPSKSVVFFCLALSNLLGSSPRSGVGWRSVSRLCADVESLSRDESGVIESRLISSPVWERTEDATRVSSAVLPAAVPHATSDLKTATMHSSPCLFNWFSDSPMTDVSIVPETDKTDVVSEGGTPFWSCFVVGLSAGLGGSLAFCWAAVKGVVPIFEMIFIRLKERHLWASLTRRYEGYTHCSYMLSTASLSQS